MHGSKNATKCWPKGGAECLIEMGAKGVKKLRKNGSKNESKSDSKKDQEGFKSRSKSGLEMY